jgi:hypothetical protein
MERHQIAVQWHLGSWKVDGSRTAPHNRDHQIAGEADWDDAARWKKRRRI